MIKLKRTIFRYLKGRNILALFLLTNIIYSFMLLVSIPKVMAFSNGMKLLDMMPFGYDTTYVNRLFEILGDKGREAYLYIQLPIDMVYPLCFGISYCLILGYFLNKLQKLDTSLIYLCLLPILTGLFDYLENFGIYSMLINYPNYSENLIMSTNIFTIIKSVLTTIYFFILVGTLITLGIRTLKK